ncbi:hypothetical protein [Rhizobium lusitanum]|uniref:Uncharacterized protein n=1 Tax=Rhizobium lusitanum TaxID=293958 RepID=A0A7X0MFC9_9HYPH|nr:hypothetical protein [Rhizobium lusitanum]MBB6486985.1 hypothetical protein [Rhizobium lusitanum]
MEDVFDKELSIKNGTRLLSLRILVTAQVNVMTTFRSQSNHFALIGDNRAKATPSSGDVSRTFPFSETVPTTRDLD